MLDAGGGDFALFGEADYINAAALDDPELEGFGLEVGALIT